MEVNKNEGVKKRILASVLAVAMMITSISVTGITAVAEENPALILGADYIITSKSSGKVLDVEGNSREEGAKIIQKTASDSDFQIWTVTDGGDGYYNLVNKVSGKGIDVPNSSKKAGTELKQYNNGSNRNYQKFAITDDGDGYYRITPKQVSNFAIRVKDDSREDGATIVQAEAEGADCEKWSFQLVKPDYAISDYEAVAREAYDSWLDKFYYVDENGYGRLNNMNGFWTEAQVLEMFVDAYEHFGDEKYLKLAQQLYDGLIEKRDVNWKWNGYTDDTMYMTIATIRLYMVTNDPRQLNIAKRNFDMIYARAVQDDGTLIWCTDEDKQFKNACANCPAMIAAVYMGRATGDTSYYDKAEKIWDWVYPNLFEEQYKKTGGYDDTGIQGIFIGSSALLYSVTGNQKYKDVALRACEVAKTLGEGANEILNGEGVKGGDYNSVAAKGILARWLGYFLELCPEVTQYDYWMEINADSAWENRNSDNLMWGHFGTQTMEKVEECEDYYESSDNVQKKQYASWACSAAVSWLINCTGLPVVGKEIENANKIEAENATISGGATVENEAECSNEKCVGNIGVKDGSVQFTFKSDNDGKALLSLYYDANEAGKYNVTVNNENTYTVDCPSTNDPACLSVDFVKGDNTVVISGVVGETSPNLDYAGVNLSYYVEMEDGYRENGARIGNNESCSGGKSLTWLGGDKGGSVAFMIPAEADGKAKLAFPYATNGARKLKVTVNGKSKDLDCQSTKSWDVFSSEPFTMDIDLQKGRNEIIFTGVDGESAPNLDWLELEWLYNEAQIADEDSIIVYDPDAEKKEEDQKAADAVIAAIESIREADVTLEDAESIAEIRASYDALTQEQQDLISDEQLKILTSAESKLKELQEAADKDATEPTGETKPTEPTKPTDTTEPTDMAKPTEPASEPTKPTDTTEPTGITKPTEPTSEPTKPTGTTEPTGMEKPTEPTSEPTKPTDTTEPTGITKPTEPASEPTKPTDTAEPTDTTEPAGETKPTEPTKPSDPAKPSDPTKPGSGAGTVPEVAKPGTPKISVKIAASNAIKISWKKVAGADGYAIYRATSKNGKYVQCAAVSKSKTSWKNTKLKSGKTYYYQVAAYKKSGNGNTYGSKSKAVGKKVLGKPAKPKVKITGNGTQMTFAFSVKQLSKTQKIVIYHKSNDGKFKVWKTIPVKKKTVTYSYKDFIGGRHSFYIRTYYKVDGKKISSRTSSTVSVDL